MAFDKSKTRSITDFTQFAQRDLPDNSTAQQSIIVDEISGNKLKINTDGSINAGLIVEDIEIGAVEIKDATSDVRQTVETKGSKGAAAVQILDASGNQITSFGGTPPSIVGLKDTSNTIIDPAKENGNLADIKTNTDNIPELGQADITHSTPVVLPVSQITTLTPPAQITGFATSAKQDTLIDQGKYNVNHIDDYTTTSVTYIGKEDKDGAWFIKKLDETGNFPVITYATLTNNPTLTTYIAALTARVTATYNLYSVAF